MYIKNQKFLILGVSKSGFSAAGYILKNGGKCYFYEELESDRIQKAENELISRGAIKVSADGIDEAIKESDALVISPGVPINHEVAVKAKTMGKRITGELEFAFETISPVIIGVTGTNGKTTTVSLIDAILEKAGIKRELAGNVGIPVSSVTEKTDRDTVFVTEVSSFQLESVSDFKPHVSCILNISPDHLERHYSMENYIFLKKRIFRNQRESEYCVLNYDDETVRSFYPEIKAAVVWVSVNERVDGAYAEGDVLYYKGEPVATTSDIPLSGKHNVYNALFAIAVAKLFGVKNEAIVSALKNFKGVPHRNQMIGEMNGVKFYDDSKATNTASAITAISDLSLPAVLILGGSEKGEKYDRLFATINDSKVIHTVITGAARENMLQAAARAGNFAFTVTDKFEKAVEIAKSVAKSGQCVLLSPACASFDEFRCCEERGDVFKKLVFGGEKK